MRIKYGIHAGFLDAQTNRVMFYNIIYKNIIEAVKLFKTWENGSRPKLKRSNFRSARTLINS